MFHTGRPLTPIEYAYFEPYFQAETLDKARIIDGHVPFWLRKCMSAVVLGHKIFMREGAYLLTPQPSFAALSLLAHELTHVEQYLSGMTIIKYLWASRHGYMRNPYELEAYAKGYDIAKQINDNREMAL